MRSATGNPDQISGGTRGHDRFDGTISHALAPGEYELVFTFDVGTVPQSATFRGLDGRPGTVDKWPNPLAKWQTTITGKIRIVGKDEPVIALVTDPGQDPLKAHCPAVKEALVRPATRGLQLVIKWQDLPYPEMPLSYRVTAVAGEQRMAFGSYLVARCRSKSTASISEQADMKSLPPEVTSIDLEFTPDPVQAERIVGIDRIWGLPYQIKNVPLARYDLQPN